LVEAGEPDGPAHVFHDGKHCLTVRSIHRAACLTVQEEPRIRFAPYEPHPKARIGPRLGVLLATAKIERGLRRTAKAQEAPPGVAPLPHCGDAPEAPGGAMAEVAAP
jgi:hypothetical protein